MCVSWAVIIVQAKSTEGQFMGDHPNLSTASMSAPAVISGLIGSKSTTTSSRNAEARSSSKKIGREPAGPVRNRTKLVSEIGSEPATLTSTIAASTNHKMAAGASERIHHNAPLPRRTGKSKPKNPDPFLCYTKPSRRVLDHIRQLAAKIKDFEVPESGGLQVELMELVIAEFPETASDANVRSANILKSS